MSSADGPATSAKIIIWSLYYACYALALTVKYVYALPVGFATQNVRQIQRLVCSADPKYSDSPLCQDSYALRAAAIVTLFGLLRASLGLVRSVLVSSGTFFLRLFLPFPEGEVGDDAEHFCCAHSHLDFIPIFSNFNDGGKVGNAGKQSTSPSLEQSENGQGFGTEEGTVEIDKEDRAALSSSSKPEEATTCQSDVVRIVPRDEGSGSRKSFPPVSCIAGDGRRSAEDFSRKALEFGEGQLLKDLLHEVVLRAQRNGEESKAEEAISLTPVAEIIKEPASALPRSATEGKARGKIGEIIKKLRESGMQIFSPATDDGSQSKFTVGSSNVTRIASTFQHGLENGSSHLPREIMLPNCVGRNEEQVHPQYLKECSDEFCNVRTYGVLKTGGERKFSETNTSVSRRERPEEDPESPVGINGRSESQFLLHVPVELIGMIDPCNNRKFMDDIGRLGNIVKETKDETLSLAVEQQFVADACVS